MHHAWNTHCHYSKDGQRIAAELREDGSVVFVDIDRGIYGLIEEPCMLPIRNISDLRGHVMLCYMHNNYKAAWSKLEQEAIARLVGFARKL